MSYDSLQNYVLKHLATDLAEVQLRGQFSYQLDEFESTIIYKYTKDGYRELNEYLRNSDGAKLPEFGEHLKFCLEKLPSYKGLAYRGVTLTQSQLELYHNHLTSGRPKMEYAFLSTSRRRTRAMRFGLQPLFVIHSKNGKLVERYARFGSGSTYNEWEVIFPNSSTFMVADISKENDRVVITMFEL